MDQPTRAERERELIDSAPRTRRSQWSCHNCMLHIAAEDAAGHALDHPGQLVIGETSEVITYQSKDEDP